MQPKKSLSEAYQSFFQNLFNFNGRSRRSDYWPVVILNSIVVSIVSGAITGALGADSVAGSVISYVLSLALFVLELGLVVRRLHDTGKEWTYILLSLIPVVGWIIVLIALLKDSDPGDNKFGPNPKAIYADPAQAYQQPAQPYQPQPVAPPQPPIQPAQPVQQPYQPVEPVQPVEPEPTTYYQPQAGETTYLQPEDNNNM